MILNVNKPFKNTKYKSLTHSLWLIFEVLLHFVRRAQEFVFKILNGNIKLILEHFEFLFWAIFNFIKISISILIKWCKEP